MGCIVRGKRIVSPITKDEMRAKIEASSLRAKGFESCGVQVLPWIGSRYATVSPRILVVGESSYLPNENSVPQMAIAVCEVGRFERGGFYTNTDDQEQKKQPTGSFHLDIVTFITGHRLKGRDFVDAWEDWAFWELVQDYLPDRKTRPTSEQLANGWNAFERLAGYFKESPSLKPDIVVAVGYRMRDCPPKGVKEGFKPIGESPYFVRYRETAIPIQFVKHPASYGLNRLGEHDRIVQALGSLRP